MRNSLILALCLGLLCTTCARKAADPIPDPIPDNSIQMIDNGVPVVFAAATVHVVVSNGGKRIDLTAATDDNARHVGIGATDYQSVEMPRTYVGDAVESGYTLPLTEYSTVCHSAYPGTQFYQFSTRSAHPDFQLMVLRIDPVNHRINGTFAGSYFLGCDHRTVTNGQFNLPYMVQP